MRKKKLLGESAIQKLRGGDLVSWENLEMLCKLLDYDIGDVLEYRKEEC